MKIKASLTVKLLQEKDVFVAVVDYERPEGGLAGVGAACSRAASAWSMYDDALGAVLRKLEQFAPGRRFVVADMGVHYGVGIVSFMFTFTPAHIEDLAEGAVNDLLFGAFKVWSFEPPANEGAFIELLTRKYGPDARARLFAKRLVPVLTVAEMREIDVELVFQPPGFTVLSLPGLSYHWTTSLGFSIAEASNFVVGGATLGQVRM